MQIGKDVLTNWRSVKLENGVAVNEVTNTGWLHENINDETVPTEYSVKKYIDANIATYVEKVNSDFFDNLLMTSSPIISAYATKDFMNNDRLNYLYVQNGDLYVRTAGLKIAFPSQDLDINIGNVKVSDLVQVDNQTQEDLIINGNFSEPQNWSLPSGYELHDDIGLLMINATSSQSMETYTLGYEPNTTYIIEFNADVTSGRVQLGFSNDLKEVTNGHNVFYTDVGAEGHSFVIKNIGATITNISSISVKQYSIVKSSESIVLSNKISNNEFDVNTGKIQDGLVSATNGLDKNDYSDIIITAGATMQYPYNGSMNEFTIDSELRAQVDINYPDGDSIIFVDQNQNIVLKPFTKYIASEATPADQEAIWYDAMARSHKQYDDVHNEWVPSAIASYAKVNILNHIIQSTNEFPITNIELFKFTFDPIDLHKDYLVSFTISDYTSGSIRFRIGDYTSRYYNDNGSYSINDIIVTATNTVQMIFESGNNGFVGRISNIRIKKYNFVKDGTFSNKNYWDNLAYATINDEARQLEINSTITSQKLASQEEDIERLTTDVCSFDVKCVSERISGNGSVNIQFGENTKSILNTESSLTAIDNDGKIQSITRLSMSIASNKNTLKLSGTYNGIINKIELRRGLVYNTDFAFDEDFVFEDNNLRLWCAWNDAKDRVAMTNHTLEIKSTNTDYYYYSPYTHATLKKGITYKATLKFDSIGDSNDFYIGLFSVDPSQKDEDGNVLITDIQKSSGIAALGTNQIATYTFKVNDDFDDINILCGIITYTPVDILVKSFMIEAESYLPEYYNMEYEPGETPDWEKSDKFDFRDNIWFIDSVGSEQDEVAKYIKFKSIDPYSSEDVKTDRDDEQLDYTISFDIKNYGGRGNLVVKLGNEDTFESINVVKDGHYEFNAKLVQDSEFKMIANNFKGEIHNLKMLPKNYVINGTFSEKHNWNYNSSYQQTNNGLAVNSGIPLYNNIGAKRYVRYKIITNFYNNISGNAEIGIGDKTNIYESGTSSGTYTKYVVADSIDEAIQLPLYFATNDSNCSYVLKSIVIEEDDSVYNSSFLNPVNWYDPSIAELKREKLYMNNYNSTSSIKELVDAEAGSMYEITIQATGDISNGLNVKLGSDDGETKYESNILTYKIVAGVDNPGVLQITAYNNGHNDDPSTSLIITNITMKAISDTSNVDEPNWIGSTTEGVHPEYTRFSKIIGIKNISELIKNHAYQEFAFLLENGDYCIGFFNIANLTIEDCKRGIFGSGATAASSTPTAQAVVNNNTIVFKKLNYIYATDQKTFFASGTAPIYSAAAPIAEKNTVWFDMNENKFKRYYNGEWQSYEIAFIGLAICGTKDPENIDNSCVACYSLDAKTKMFNYNKMKAKYYNQTKVTMDPSNGDNDIEYYKSANPMIPDVFSDQTIDIKRYPYRGRFNFSINEMKWETPIVADTHYYLYLSEDDELGVSIKPPVYFSELNLYKHPYANMICMFEGISNSDATGFSCIHSVDYDDIIYYYPGSNYKFGKVINDSLNKYVDVYAIGGGGHGTYLGASSIAAKGGDSSVIGIIAGGGMSSDLEGIGRIEGGTISGTYDIGYNGNYGIKSDPEIPDGSGHYSKADRILYTPTRLFRGVNDNGSLFGFGAGAVGTDAINGGSGAIGTRRVKMYELYNKPIIVGAGSKLNSDDKYPGHDGAVIIKFVEEE